MYERFCKRALDMLLAATALLLLLPMLLAIGIAVRLVDGSPVLFRQVRIGRDGVPFEFLKFRSMPVNTGSIASDKLGSVSISAVGRLIRRTNADELPQLINILKGDMSVVGPRPPIPSQQDLIRLRQENGALGLRPGLTGLAQVNSYNAMPVCEKARFDGLYASRVTLVGDLAIILRTVTYLLKPPPVY